MEDDMRGNKTGKLILDPFGTGDDDESQDGTDDSLCGVPNASDAQG